MVCVGCLLGLALDGVLLGWVSLHSPADGGSACGNPPLAPRAGRPRLALFGLEGGLARGVAALRLCANMAIVIKHDNSKGSPEGEWLSQDRWRAHCSAGVNRTRCPPPSSSQSGAR